MDRETLPNNLTVQIIDKRKEEEKKRKKEEYQQDAATTDVVYIPFIL
jgi:hypothetical protein